MKAPSAHLSSSGNCNNNWLIRRNTASNKQKVVSSANKALSLNERTANEKKDEQRRTTKKGVNNKHSNNIEHQTDQIIVELTNRQRATSNKVNSWNEGTNILTNAPRQVGVYVRCCCTTNEIDEQTNKCIITRMHEKQTNWNNGSGRSSEAQTDERMTKIKHSKKK